MFKEPRDREERGGENAAFNNGHFVGSDGAHTLLRPIDYFWSQNYVTCFYYHFYEMCYYYLVYSCDISSLHVNVCLSFSPTASWLVLIQQVITIVKMYQIEYNAYKEM